MLSLIGYVTMLIILALLLTQKVSPVVALAGVPLVAALIAGQSPTDISEFVSAGIAGVADVVVMFIFGAVSLEIWHTQMPIWALVLALAISFVYTVPIGMIQAITNQQVGLNVIAELIVGYVLPGRPIAMMMFKTYGYITMYQALQFASDFKLGHYMKVP